MYVRTPHPLPNPYKFLFNLLRLNPWQFKMGIVHLWKKSKLLLLKRQGAACTEWYWSFKGINKGQFWVNPDRSHTSIVQAWAWRKEMASSRKSSNSLFPRGLQMHPDLCFTQQWLTVFLADLPSVHLQLLVCTLSNNGLHLAGLCRRLHGLVEIKFRLFTQQDPWMQNKVRTLN